LPIEPGFGNIERGGTIMRNVAIVIILVILAFLVLDFNTRTAELSRLRSEHERVNIEHEAKIQTISALEEKIAYATSEAAVNQWAYENHRIRPGDIPVVPVENAVATALPTPRPVATQAQISNLDRWLLLFFDPEKP
jgi:hypothetical protein